MIRTIGLRILAVFTASAMGVIGAGAIAGIPLWKAAFMAGIGGVVTVVEGLAKAYIADGQLSKEEIDDAFDEYDEEDEE